MTDPSLERAGRAWALLLDAPCFPFQGPAGVHGRQPRAGMSSHQALAGCQGCRKSLARVTPSRFLPDPEVGMGSPEKEN